ncbi:hypothetical protein FE257_009097 [Aspergillus nanangensis]|uniref:Uncharacterized protein n=1 Tax=Aspergillus nanangensis TaxID=2582783 RepID=A0AAD4CWQ0_ASPNN|nr:hypothetical protein FE257_009097 [Aspergillus nanangensis]
MKFSSKFTLAQLVTTSLLSPAYGIWPFDKASAAVATVTETSVQTVTVPGSCEAAANAPGYSAIPAMIAPPADDALLGLTVTVTRLISLGLDLLPGDGGETPAPNGGETVTVTQGSGGTVTVTDTATLPAETVTVNQAGEDGGLLGLTVTVTKILSLGLDIPGGENDIGTITAPPAAVATVTETASDCGGDELLGLTLTVTHLLSVGLDLFGHKTTKTLTVTETSPGQTVTLPGETETDTVTRTLPGSTYTITSVVPPTTVTVSGSVTTLPGSTITSTVTEPGRTITEVGPTVTLPGSTYTTTTVIPASTITLSGSVTTIPASTVTSIITEPGPTVTMPGSTYTTTTVIPASTITLSGSVTTIPASTITSIITEPGSTVTVPGDDTTIPGPTVTQIITTTIFDTVTITTTGAGETQPGETGTVTAPGSTVTVSASVCPALPARSTYTPSSEVPDDYTWGCAPGYICHPKRSGDASGCNVQVGLPDEGYLCSPEECIKAPDFTMAYENYTKWEHVAKKDLRFNVTQGYFNLKPANFGLDNSVFQVNKVVPTHRYDARSRRSLWGGLLSRQDSGVSHVAPICYLPCSTASEEIQKTGKSKEICGSDSVFQRLLGKCQTCCDEEDSDGEGSFEENVQPDFAQYLNWCQYHGGGSTSAAGQTVGSSTTTAGGSTSTTGATATATTSATDATTTTTAGSSQATSTSGAEPTGSSTSASSSSSGESSGGTSSASGSQTASSTGTSGGAGGTSASSGSTETSGGTPTETGPAGSDSAPVFTGAASTLSGPVHWGLFGLILHLFVF